MRHDADMILIPAGEFTMGSNKEESDTMWRGSNTLNPYGFNNRPYIDEHPAHKVVLPAFEMDKYEVTNAQYRNFFISAQHSAPLTWIWNGYNLNSEFLASLPVKELRQVATEKFKLDMDVSNMGQQALLAELEKIQVVRHTLPVTTVTWVDADAYCHWAGKRLPTEAEWEKAARGPMDFEYPWGGNWDLKKINTAADNPMAPYAAVGSFPGDRSGYGIFDMASNVTEWVADWYDAYPGAPASDRQYYNYGKIERVVRGGMSSTGHYDALSLTFRTARRDHLPPDTALVDLGFRCAKNIK